VACRESENQVVIGRFHDGRGARGERLRPKRLVEPLAEEEHRGFPSSQPADQIRGTEVSRDEHHVRPGALQGGDACVARQLAEHFAPPLFETGTECTKPVRVVVNEEDGVGHGLSRM
jgi:hypothetical protein